MKFLESFEDGHVLIAPDDWDPETDLALASLLHPTLKIPAGNLLQGEEGAHLVFFVTVPTSMTGKAHIYLVDGSFWKTLKIQDTYFPEGTKLRCEIGWRRHGPDS